MKRNRSILLALAALFVFVNIVGCDKTVSETKQESGSGGKGLSPQEKKDKQG